MMEDVALFDGRPSIKRRLNDIYWLPAGFISVFMFHPVQLFQYIYIYIYICSLYLLFFDLFHFK